MRKWLGLGALTIAAVGAIAYWQFTKTAPPDVDPIDGRVAHRSKNVHNDGDAEASDVIEPLIVYRDPEDVLRHGEQLREYGRSQQIDTVPLSAISRVEINPSTTQAPRPDGNSRRMPYADEEGALGIPLDPLTWILDATMPRVGVFEQLKEGGTEESEPRETTPPGKPMQADPVMDYHHSYPHCPYHGPCPYPHHMPRY